MAAPQTHPPGRSRGKRASDHLDPLQAILGPLLLNHLMTETGRPRLVTESGPSRSSSMTVMSHSSDHTRGCHESPEAREKSGDFLRL